jgi:hypothetical protein
MGALVGKALAKQIPDNATGNQARLMFGLLTRSLASAYGTLAEYDSSGIAQATGLDAGSVRAAREYLDSTNSMLGDYFPDMPTSDQVLTAQQLAELRTAVSGASVAAQQIDQLFGTSWLEELADAIIEAAGTISAKVAAATAKVLGSTIGALWWLIVLGLAGLYAWHRWGHKVVT